MRLRLTGGWSRASMSVRLCLRFGDAAEVKTQTAPALTGGAGYGLPSPGREAGVSRAESPCKGRLATRPTLGPLSGGDRPGVLRGALRLGALLRVPARCVHGAHGPPRDARLRSVERLRRDGRSRP